MKISLFSQAAYRQLPGDFEQRHTSCVSTPYSLTRPEFVYDSYRDYLDELLHAARLGFDGVSVTEHAQSSYDMVPNPNLIASALAYATELEDLPVAIYPLGRSLGKTREPLRVAEEYAMIDVISGGRLIAGFPIGLSYDASMNNGVPPIDMRRQFDENLALIVRAWTEPEPFPWNGAFSKYQSVNIWPRPLQAPRPPVFMPGSGTPRTMRFTLEQDFGFNYFGWFGQRVTGRRVFDRFWEMADSLGYEANPYRVGFMQTIAIAETDAKARRDYAEHLEYFFRKGLGSIPAEYMDLPGATDINGVRALVKDPGDLGIFAELKHATFDDLVSYGSVVIGSPETVRDTLVEFCRENRVGNILAMLGFGSLPRELVMQNITLFATEVAPALRSIWADSGFEHHWWPERLGGKPSGQPLDRSSTVA